MIAEKSISTANKNFLFFQGGNLVVDRMRSNRVITPSCLGPPATLLSEFV